MIDLKKYRQDAGLTQVQMARKLKTTQSGISRLERQDDIKLSTLQGYLKACKYSLLIGKEI